jgi:hypothetical protein
MMGHLKERLATARPKRRHDNMAMNKKYFEMLAWLIKNASDIDDEVLSKYLFVENLYHQLKVDNPHFDRNKFIDACTVRK